jgi:hypothetical protein
VRGCSYGCFARVSLQRRSVLIGAVELLAGGLSATFEARRTETSPAEDLQAEAGCSLPAKWRPNG